MAFRGVATLRPLRRHRPGPRSPGGDGCRSAAEFRSGDGRQDAATPVLRRGVGETDRLRRHVYPRVTARWCRRVDQWRVRCVRAAVRPWARRAPGVARKKSGYRPGDGRDRKTARLGCVRYPRMRTRSWRIQRSSGACRRSGPASAMPTTARLPFPACDTG